MKKPLTITSLSPLKGKEENPLGEKPSEDNAWFMNDYIRQLDDWQQAESTRKEYLITRYYTEDERIRCFKLAREKAIPQYGSRMEYIYATHEDYFQALSPSLGDTIECEVDEEKLTATYIKQ